MRFLIVDDSGTMRRIMVSALQRIGYTDFVEAADGEEALERFDPSIGCVLTDWNMPNLGGVEFVRAVRGRPGGVTVPIIMVTTRSIREDIIEAAKAGVSNYIVKPFTPQVLKDKLEQVLGTLAEVR
jgi:two-component system chemotaxis response regulator CheY